MKSQLISEAACFILIANIWNFGSVTSLRLLDDSDSDSYLKTLQIIRKYGYPAEAHVTETDDGYLLEMHRIPHRRNEKPSGGRTPVLLTHALLGSSVDYFIAGADKCLPFFLVEQGYDVWLANFRGNSYSRAHTHLTPDMKQFWDFTWHESGFYDLPAHIDFITNYTQVPKIMYLGYSTNALSYFVLTSTRPDYQAKIKGTILAAPLVFTTKTTIGQRQLARVSPYSSELQILAEKLVGGKISGQSFLYRFIIRNVCTLTELEKNVCKNILLSIFRQDHGQFNESLVPNLLYHFPSGSSTKSLAHLGQIIESGKFQQYDYGTQENLNRYGRETPPEYNLDAVVTPIYVFYGMNDNFVTLTDLNHLALKVKSIKKIENVDNIYFNHIDFVLGNDIKKLLFERVLKLFQQIESE